MYYNTLTFTKWCDAPNKSSRLRISCKEFDWICGACKISALMALQNSVYNIDALCAGVITIPTLEAATFQNKHEF